MTVIIIPQEITNSHIDSTTATNADADYVAGTTYALDAKATYGNFIYKSLQNGNVGKQPDLASSAAWWALVGSSNKWAMFDATVSTQTTATDTLTVVLEASYINSFSVLNLTASSFEFSYAKGATVIRSETVELLDYSLITDWAEYYFSEHQFQSEYSIVDLPPLPGCTLTVTFAKPSSTVGVGKMVVGRTLDVGLDQYNLKREVIDYSVVTFDEFSDVTITNRGYARKYSARVQMENVVFDAVSKKLDSISGVPVVCIGGNGFKSSLTVYGLVSYSIDLARYQVSYVSLEVKGLT